MAKYKIESTPDICTGCLRCQLGCSELNAGMFNPDLANIIVIETGVDCQISFRDTCKHCGICADSCFYGALGKTRMVEAK